MESIQYQDQGECVCQLTETLYVWYLCNTLIPPK